MASGGGSSAGAGGGFRHYPTTPKNSNAPWVPPASRTMSLPTEFPLFYKELLKNATQAIDTLGEPIATGASARVYLVRVNGFFYIIKRVLPSFMDKFITEVDNFNKIKGTDAEKHVVTFLASTQTSKGGFILFPYVPGMTLHKWLAQGHAPEKKSDMESKVATAIKALHDAGVIHSDVKSNNIYILEENNKPLLLDLGESIIIDTIDFLDYREDINRNFHMLKKAFEPPLVQQVALPSPKDPIADRIKQLLPASGMGGGYRKKSRSRPKRPAKKRAKRTKRAKTQKRKRTRSRSRSRSSHHQK